MSKLLKEDDEFLYLREYLHHDSDSYSDWMLNPETGKYDKYPIHITVAADSALYEIRVDFRVRKSDGKVFYDSFN